MNDPRPEGLHGTLHRTTEILSHARRRGYVAARGARAAGRGYAAHLRAHEPRRRRSRSTRPHHRLRAGPAATRLDRWPQRAGSWRAVGRQCTCNDLLLIVESPSGDNVAKFALATGSLGNVRTSTAR